MDFAGGAAASKRAATSYGEITGGMDGDAEVSVGQVSTDGDAATGELDWSWKVGSKTWTYETTVRLAKGETADGDAWLVRWDPALVEPSLKDGERLVESTVLPERGRILGAQDAPLVTPRPVLRVGVDKTGLTAAQAADAARQVAQLIDVDVRAYAKQVQVGRSPCLRAGHRLPQAGRPRLTCSPGWPTSPGRRRHRRRAAAGADQGVRRRDPRDRRPGDRGAGQGERRPDQGRRRRRSLRPAEAVRRAADRHPRSHRRGRAARATSAVPCSPPTRWPAPRCAPRSTSTPRPRPSRRSPTSGRPSALVAIRPLDR